MMAVFTMLKQAPMLILAAFAAIVALLARGKITAVEERGEKNEMATEVVENHTVAAKESDAKTDADVDAALDASARADRT